MALNNDIRDREYKKFKEVGSQTTVAVSTFDSSGSQIDLAKESTLASIKTNTDLIPTDPSTETKQDNIISSLGNIEFNTVNTQNSVQSVLAIVATEDKQDDIITAIGVLNSLVPSAYDYTSLTYTTGNLTGVVFKTGGSGGTTVSTLTLAYDSDNNLTSVTKT